MNNLFSIRKCRRNRFTTTPHQNPSFPTTYPYAFCPVINVIHLKYLLEEKCGTNWKGKSLGDEKILQFFTTFTRNQVLSGHFSKKHGLAFTTGIKEIGCVISVQFLVFIMLQEMGRQDLRWTHSRLTGYTVFWESTRSFTIDWHKQINQGTFHVT